MFVDGQDEDDEARVDADDFDAYDYDRCAPRFADDDGDQSMEGVSLQDILEIEDEDEEGYADRIMGSLRAD